VGLPVVVLDGLGDLIEVPLLSSNVLSPSVEPDIVSTVALSNSIHWESRNNVEWSIDVESKVFVETLGWISFHFINIGHSPLLILTIVVLIDTNFAAFFIFATCNIKNFAVIPIDELSVFIFENLPPTRVSAPDLHVLGLS